MSHFTEAQLAGLETIFGLQRGDTLPVRDGVVTRSTKVWWRGASGPELVIAGDPLHWGNIRDYPDVYQLTEPITRILYVE